MSEVIEVVERDELNDLLDTEDFVIVKFTAPAWCVPCQQFAPHFESAARSAKHRSDMLGRATFVTVDIDKADWAMVDYGIKSVPTVKVFLFGEYKTDVAKHPDNRSAPKFLAELSYLIK